MGSHHVVVLLVICVYIFSPAALVWWDYLDEYWYQPWIFWFLLITCGFVLQRLGDKE